MTQVEWSNNNPEGRGLRRAFRRLEAKLDGAEDIHELTELVRAMGYIAQIKAGIAKNHELEERIKKLEDLLHIAQTTQATT